MVPMKSYCIYSFIQQMFVDIYCMLGMIPDTWGAAKGQNRPKESIFVVEKTDKNHSRE